MIKDNISNPEYKKDFITLIIIAFLLLLRFPFLILISFKVAKINHAAEIYYYGTYILTALLIFWKRNDLKDFNIGISTLFIFILFPIAKPLSYILLKSFLPCEDAYKLQWMPIISAILALVLIYKRPVLLRGNRRETIKWLLISIGAGLSYAILTGFVYSTFTQRSIVKATFPLFLNMFIVQTSNAAIMEEPLFRGFLWGHLRMKGWGEWRILIFQAAIFMLGHVYYLPKLPIAFIGTFFAGIVLGLLVLKSKNISTSIIAHGLINSVGQLVMYYTW